MVMIGILVRDAVVHQALEASDVPVVRSRRGTQALDRDDQDLLASYGRVYPALGRDSEVLLTMDALSDPRTGSPEERGC